MFQKLSNNRTRFSAANPAVLGCIRVHFCPDGPLSGALMLKALEDENKSLSEFIRMFPSILHCGKICMQQHAKVSGCGTNC